MERIFNWPVLLFGAVGVFLVLGLLAFALGYNRLVRLRNKMREGWSGIEVQLKRRHELIPNLVKTVEAYQNHERGTLEAVTAQRQEARAAHGVAEAARAEEKLGKGLGKLIAVAEDYPDLKADGHFRELMAELVATEDEIQYARRYYNGAVRDLNNGLEAFPSNVVGMIGGFEGGEFFEVKNAAEREVVEVKL